MHMEMRNYCPTCRDTYGGPQGMTAEDLWYSPLLCSAIYEEYRSDAEAAPYMAS